MVQADGKAGGPGNQKKIRPDKALYPSGAIRLLGQNLQLLARDKSVHTAPSRTQNGSLDCIAVPTSRDVRRNHRSIRHIMRIAAEHKAGFLLFLCSGAAKKEDIAAIAKSFNTLHWAAIDGPFGDEIVYEFQTTQSLLAYDSKRDLSQKRNLALMLARLLGWKKLFLLDDDIELDATNLARANDLLDEGAAAVGFSIRQFPDQSVAVHASQWAHAPIDSFIGGGVLAIKTDTDHLSFFPHIYNEDWLFLMLHCLMKDDDLTWAGTVRQRKYNPFKSAQRAKNEEPGDLLAESLMRLAITLKTDKLLPNTFDDLLDQIKLCADQDFWEHEINERILFIRRTEDKIRLSKLPSLKKKRVLKALESSLAILTGKDGIRGLRGSEIAAWVQAWVQDIRTWDKLISRLPQYTTFSGAVEYLGLNNQYIYNHARPTAIVQKDKTPHVATYTVPSDLAALPDIPRTPEVIRGLRSTKILQEYSGSKGLDMRTVVEDSDRLRFDRPANEQAARTVAQPLFTICMLVANGESAGLVGMSVAQIKEWAGQVAAVQLILWVHDPNTNNRHDQTEQYRDMLVSRLLPEIVGSNIYLRSETLPAQTSNIDSLIDNALESSAFAYWKQMIEGDHEVYIVNSKNELIRKGTFWDFLQRRHTVPGKPLRTYLQKTASLSATGNSPALPGVADDEQALNQARLNLLDHRPRVRWPRPRLRPTTTAKVMQSIKPTKLSWLELDDAAHNLTIHEARGTARFEDVRSVYIMPTVFAHSLASEAYAAAKTILDALSTIPKDNKAIECMVVIYGNNGNTWTELRGFRKKLLKLVGEQCTRNDIVITSLLCHPGQASTLAQAKLLATAVTNYCHWLEDHSYLPKIHWR